MISLKIILHKKSIYENFAAQLGFQKFKIFGKVTVVKTLALPILIQFISVLPYSKTKQFEGIKKKKFILSGMEKLIKFSQILL